MLELRSTSQRWQSTSIMSSGIVGRFHPVIINNYQCYCINIYHTSISKEHVREDRADFRRRQVLLALEDNNRYHHGRASKPQSY